MVTSSHEVRDSPAQSEAAGISYCSRPSSDQQFTNVEGTKYMSLVEHYNALKPNTSRSSYGCAYGGSSGGFTPV